MASDSVIPSSTAAKVPTETVQKAVKALLQWKDSKSKSEKPQLLEQDEFVYLVVTLKKIPAKERINAHKIALPHRLHSPDASSELCLFIDDRSKSKLTSADAKKKIKSEDIPISKVIKLSKLRSDYRPFEAKRKLCDSYDMFFADKRVIPLLPKLLGKQFFKKSKIPVPVDLTHNNWKEQIDKSCSSALLYLRTGTCSVVKVGKASMESGEIVENVVAAIDGVAETVPKKWGGVRSFHLKFSESLALPIFQTVPVMKLKIDGMQTNGEAIEEDIGSELDTKEVVSGDEEKVSNKKVKGSMKKVRYMDTDVVDDELGTEIANEKGEKEDDIEMGSADNEMGSAENGDKKRKKRGLVGTPVLSELNGQRGKRTRKVVAEEDKVELKKEKKKPLVKKDEKTSKVVAREEDVEPKKEEKKSLVKKEKKTSKLVAEKEDVELKKEKKKSPVKKEKKTSKVVAVEDNVEVKKEKKTSLETKEKKTKLKDDGAVKASKDKKVKRKQVA